MSVSAALQHIHDIGILASYDPVAIDQARFQIGAIRKYLRQRQRVIPYSYDESRQYNVFHLMHGGWAMKIKPWGRRYRLVLLQRQSG